MAEKNRSFVVGVDLGGTKILSSVISSDGEICSRDLRMTPAAQGPDAVIRAVLESAGQALDLAGVDSSALEAIGVGAPGLSNSETGVVFTSPHLPGWQDIPLKDIIEKEFDKDTFIINDADAAAIGECCFGAAKGASNFVYITISTGIGGGVVIGGKLYKGAGGIAGEVGHMTIDDKGPLCSCGNTGCWETLASGTALAREARRQIENGARTSIIDHSDGDSEKITAQTVHVAAESGDALAKDLIARTSHYIGVGLTNLINIFNPELIVIGGGLSNIGDMLLAPAFEIAEKRTFKEAFRSVRFARAELGGDVGVLGAAAFALQEIKKAGRGRL
jgi:glucokinase